jgi:AcrR family transcriptional regulator
VLYDSNRNLSSDSAWQYTESRFRLSISVDKPLRADARRNRQRIVKAAAEQIAERGLDVQMEDIAHAAGVGVGTIYRHFPTKQALIDALWDDKRERMIGVAREALKNPDPWGAVVDLFELGVAMQVDDLGWCQAFGFNPRGITEAAAAPELVEATTAIVDRAHAAGVLRGDFGFEDVGRTFCAMGSVIATHGPEAGAAMLRVILDGLRAHP